MTITAISFNTARSSCVTSWGSESPAELYALLLGKHHEHGNAISFKLWICNGDVTYSSVLIHPVPLVIETLQAKLPRLKPKVAIS